MSQLQCPNCGGYKISTTANYVRKKPIPIWGKAIWIIFTQIFAFVGLIQIGSDSFSLWTVGILDLISIIYIVTFKTKKTTGYQFTCDLCGYKWDWLIGDPWPAVRVQPNLIATGAKRLEQQRAAIKCKGCGNTVPEGYPYCPFCGTSR